MERLGKRQREDAHPLEQMAGIIAASVRSPYNFVFAGAILLYLTRFSSDGHSTIRQLLRYLGILASTFP